MRIDRIDHFVLTVADVDATCAFYERVLGMRVITFDGGRKALQFGDQRINLHQRGTEIEPKAANLMSGSAEKGTSGDSFDRPCSRLKRNRPIFAARKTVV
jgi:catechol 2,3-dioxygenase-like lactoylglutathione lyase family enzyme